MWSLVRRQDKCRAFLDGLEDTPAAARSHDEVLEFLPEELRGHALECAQCNAAAADLVESRRLLGHASLEAFTPGPWFATRVLAAIEDREAAQATSDRTWAAVPRLASRLTLATAVALLVTTTWLYRHAAESSPVQRAETSESLFDSAPAGLTQDEVLTSLGERTK